MEDMRIFCPVCNTENIVAGSSLENMRCLNCDNDLQSKVEPAELAQLGKDMIRCPSCKTECATTAAFCNSCGLSLSTFASINKQPVAGMVSIFSAPVGFFIVYAVAKILPKYDFLGFATLLLIWVVLICAGITGLVSGVIALRPTMNSRNNPPLGIIGIVLSVLIIGLALFLKKWINHLA